ncbi:hypothetical protein [Dactylosporangium salmoneum]|uniref:Uncharacterized protein n=1 Tax=Dactylosporangium salmoneum TaxID=53361 RepID=A0ABP5T713_9ACTN
MIIRVQHDRTLVDAAALFVHFGRSYAIQTIRHHCQVESVDPATGVQLYDLEMSEEVMRPVRARAPHRRTRRTSDGP